MSLKINIEFQIIKNITTNSEFRTLVFKTVIKNEYFILSTCCRESSVIYWGVMLFIKMHNFSPRSEFCFPK